MKGHYLKGLLSGLLIGICGGAMLFIPRGVKLQRSIVPTRQALQDAAKEAREMVDGQVAA